MSKPLKIKLRGLGITTTIQDVAAPVKKTTDLVYIIGVITLSVDWWARMSN